MISDSIDLSTRRITWRRESVDRPRGDGIGVDIPESGIGRLVWASFWSRAWLIFSPFQVVVWLTSGEYQVVSGRYYSSALTKWWTYTRSMIRGTIIGINAMIIYHQSLTHHESYGNSHNWTDTDISKQAAMCLIYSPTLSSLVSSIHHSVSNSS